MQQVPLRKKNILEFLDHAGYELSQFDAFAARGGILPPLESGTYRVNEQMVEYLKDHSPVEHASNLAAVLAWEFATTVHKPAFITDPVSVDEFHALSRYSGLPEIPRKSLLHALNMKAVSRKVAREIGKPYAECNFVVAHLGGGISIGAQRRGRLVDVNNANDEGPFSPERTGALPCGDVVKMAFSGEYAHKELKRLFTKRGGLTAYLNTNSFQKAYDMGRNDPHAAEVIEAMAFQISKEIGGMCAVLEGNIDAIILTGGIAHHVEFVEKIKGYVSRFALVTLVPGEDELEALATGTLRVLEGQEDSRTFVFQGVKE